jgi:hypothetical protein
MEPSPVTAQVPAPVAPAVATAPVPAPYVAPAAEPPAAFLPVAVEAPAPVFTPAAPVPAPEPMVQPMQQPPQPMAAFAHYQPESPIPAAPAVPAQLPRTPTEQIPAEWNLPMAHNNPFQTAPSGPKTQPLYIEPIQQAVRIKTVATPSTDQLLLRVIFGVAEPLNAERIIHHTSQLPGVTACFCVNSQQILAQGMQTPESQSFQQHAAEIATGIQRLTHVVGMDHAEIFSIQSSTRLVTFYVAQDFTLSILHADNETAAPLRDKLTLIGRELGQLL